MRGPIGQMSLLFTPYPSPFTPHPPVQTAALDLLGLCAVRSYLSGYLVDLVYFGCLVSFIQTKNQTNQIDHIGLLRSVSDENLTCS